MDEAVEEVAACDELDRVGDHLARDERRAHPRRAHRDAVRDRDRVELHRRPAGVPDAPLHVDREIALVEVARHRLDPGRPDADDRTGEVLVREAGSLQHRAGPRAVGAVGEGRAAALGGIGRGVVRGRHGGSSLDRVGRVAAPLAEGAGIEADVVAAGEHEPLHDDSGGDARAAVAAISGASVASRAGAPRRTRSGRPGSARRRDRAARRRRASAPGRARRGGRATGRRAGADLLRVDRVVVADVGDEGRPLDALLLGLQGPA